MNWVQTEKDKIKYLASKLGEFQCNDVDPMSFPLNLKITKLLGSGAYGSVFAGCSAYDELCEFGYAIKQIDVTTRDLQGKRKETSFYLDMQKEIYKLTNSFMEQDISYGFTYVFGVIDCPYPELTRSMPVNRNDWTNEQRFNYNSYAKSGKLTESEIIDLVFAEHTSVIYIVMERGDVTLESLLNDALVSEKEQLSIFLQMYHAQLQLVKLGYHHNDLEAKNVIIYNIDKDFSLDLTIGSQTITVPFYGRRAAMIDLDSIDFIDPARGSFLKYMDLLTPVTFGLSIEEILDLASKLF